MHCVLNCGCVKRNHHTNQLTSQQHRVVLCMQCNLYRIALQVDFVISMQLLSVSVSLSVAHICCTLAWRICSELKQIVSNFEFFWYQQDVPVDSQDMFIHLQVY